FKSSPVASPRAAPPSPRASTLSFADELADACGADFVLAKREANVWQILDEAAQISQLQMQGREPVQIHVQLLIAIVEVEDQLALRIESGMDRGDDVPDIEPRRRRDRERGE